MNPKDKLATLLKSMAAVLANAKSAGREITEAELAGLEANAVEAAHLKSMLDAPSGGDPSWTASSTPGIPMPTRTRRE